jgi:hypothetical protein
MKVPVRVPVEPIAGAVATKIKLPLRFSPVNAEKLVGLIIVPAVMNVFAVPRILTEIVLPV